MLANVRGSLTPDALARVLRGLAVSRKEGILHLQRDGISKRIYLKQGFILFAGSDDEQERLGQILVQAGKLKPSDLELALTVMKETGESLGKSIVELGFTSPADVAGLAVERTRSIIRSVFSWGSGSFYFEERDTDVGHDVALQLPTAEVIYEAARGIEDSDLVRRGLGDMKAVLRQPPYSLLPYEGSARSSFQWLLDQVNGVSTMEEIVSASPLDEEKTLSTMYALVLAGLVEIESRDEAMAASTESTNVGLRQKATELAPGGPPTPSMSTMPKTLGRYAVERVLGRGAMGAVYLARDPTIDRTVAIKLIQTAVQLAPSELEKYRERFYREAKAAGKLLHPGIVTIFDVGHTEDATPFIVMEYVEGRTLDEIFKTANLEHEDVLRLGVKILEPLAYAHSCGIVHRDIKPPNVLVTPDGGIKIMDFGIAHVVGSELTHADDVLGSPNYMAPEQLSKGRIDARTDLFAFGVMLYQMLTGKLPFTGDSFAAIAKGILFEEPAPPQSLNPAVTPAVNRIVIRCLSKEPDRRYASAMELKDALTSSSAVDGEIPDADMALFADPPRSARSSAATGRDAKTISARTRGTRSPAPSSPLPNAADRIRSPSRMIMVGAFLVTALVSVLFVFSRRPSPAPESEEPATSGVPLDADSTPSPRDIAIPAAESSPKSERGRAPETSDTELYHQASVAFERGDLDTSKETLEKLLRRKPGFEGAPELLVRVNQGLRNEESGTAPEQAPAPAPAPVSPPGAAQLLYQATVAFERGDLEDSKGQLEALLRVDPSFQGASELLVKVNDEIWKKTLPISFRAKHRHRIGDCSGTLTLAAWGIRYSSEEHEWRWELNDIRFLEMDRASVLTLQTREREDTSARVGRVLGLGTPENYKFDLRTPMPDEDWARYQRLAR